MPAPAATRSAPQQAPAPIIPFTAAAHEHTEPAVDVSVTPGAAAVNLGPFDVPAYGFVRHLNIDVTPTGGVLGAGVPTGDFPFNLFQSISLNDVNGAPIYGPLDGYATLWANIIGSYAGAGADPRNTVGGYSAAINGTWRLRVPIEISHHDGFGALANQNAAASYKLALTVNPSTTLWSTAPTTIPAYRIRVSLEAWSLPNDTDVVGRPQSQFPPVHGTTQFWSQNIKAVAVGQNTLPLVRVGNLIRSLTFICRGVDGVRANGVFPDPAQLTWDARSLRQDAQAIFLQLMSERLPQMAARDTGVFTYLFNNSTKNTAGDDTPTFWLPTVQSTRLELNGVVATAGNVQIITNDIAPAEVVPSERFVETSASGFHPQMGVANASAQ